MSLAVHKNGENSHCYQKPIISSSPKIKALHPQQSEIIKFLPEAEKVRELVDKKLSQIQQDSQLHQFSQFFIQLFQKNESIFSQKSQQAKAQIAFDYYRDRFVSYLEDDKEFQALQLDIVEKVKGLLPTFLEKDIQNGLTQIVMERMRGRHSTLIEIALNKTDEIAVDINLHSPPEQYETRDSSEHPTINLFI